MQRANKCENITRSNFDFEYLNIVELARNAIRSAIRDKRKLFNSKYILITRLISGLRQDDKRLFLRRVMRLSGTCILQFIMSSLQCFFMLESSSEDVEL